MMGTPGTKRMRFIKESLIRASPERVFAFHERRDALKLLTPPWERARIVKSAQISEIGSQAIVETKIFGPLKVTWIAQHVAYDPPRSFEDVQLRGPFRSWHHRHIVEAHGADALLRDDITYEPPLALIGRLLGPWLIEKRLQRLFDYRHDVTRLWCEEGEVRVLAFGMVS